MQDRLKSLMTWQEGTMLVGGEWVPSESGQTIDVFNPATGQPIARLANANARDVDRTVAAARDAFPSWRKRDVRERAHYVLQAAAQLRERAEAIAQIATMDNGIPITIQQRLILRSADRLAYYAGLAGEIKGETIPTPGETLNYTVREPYGIAALIIPWNASLLFACGRVAPAVLAGNTVILKPAEQACLAELELGTIFAQVFPPGVVNLLTGDGPSAGTPLVAHPDVKKISFTGSRETGKEIMKRAADKLGVLTLELGGKSPNIVFPDADLDQALPGACEAMALTFNAGQTCYAGTRLFVHRSVAKEFLGRLVERFKKIRVGDPMEKSTEMGPLISQEQMQRVLGHIERGKREGAELLCGGGRPESPALQQGYFVTPTIFRAKNSMTICQEEIFGPVLSVITWDDYEQMIAEANGVKYGLAAGLWTKDLALAHRTAARLEAGYIWINHYGMTFEGTPFGGYKESGVGRVNDFKDILNYTQEKNINIRLA